jgi:hypothetical protein
VALPLALAVCEDDLRRDLTFLKAFAGKYTEIQISPLHGDSLTPRAARLLVGQVHSKTEAGFEVSAIIVHRDADTVALRRRREAAKRWFEDSGLSRLVPKLVVCAPVPCIERWLCESGAAKPRATRAKPSLGCKPWKDAWERGSGIDLDRVRLAAEAARRSLTHLADFESFHSDWCAAGLDSRRSEDDRR